MPEKNRVDPAGCDRLGPPFGIPTGFPGRVTYGRFFARGKHGLSQPLCFEASVASSSALPYTGTGATLSSDLRGWFFVWRLGSSPVTAAYHVHRQTRGVKPSQVAFAGLRWAVRSEKIRGKRTETASEHPTSRVFPRNCPIIGKRHWVGFCRLRPKCMGGPAHGLVRLPPRTALRAAHLICNRRTFLGIAQTS